MTHETIYANNYIEARKARMQLVKDGYREFETGSFINARAKKIIHLVVG